MWHFFLLYGENMKRDICDLPALTGLQLRQQIGKTRPSSPGMDSISPYELQLIARWCPDLFDHLALLLNLIENSGKWPEQIPKGAVCFIPKTNDDRPAPTDYRPLTILSAIYRLCAATRHDQLCAVWLPKWNSQNSYGLKQTKAADALAYDTCFQISLDIQQGHLAGGVSYDMKKMLRHYSHSSGYTQVFNHRGADSKVIQALSGFYSQDTFFFRIDGAYSQGYRPHNGIIQGCPLSMIFLTSLITTWIEHCTHS